MLKFDLIWSSLSGNTLKVYLRSMEFFVKFIKNGLLYKQDMLNQKHKEVILALTDRLPEYRATIHRRTGDQTTTRKVNEAFARLTPADLRKVEASEPAKNAIKLIGLSAENKPLTPNEFTTVRDYLLVTTLYENGSRPGPLENVLLSRFKQATYSASSDRHTILVDKHKTTRHHGPAELTVTSRLYSYLQIYALYIRPKYAATSEDALFVKDDGYAFRPGTVGRRVTEFFHQAGIRSDVRVTATSIRKMISDKAYELSPTKKRLIHAHMKHSERTADSNYVIRLNAERASKAHVLVQDIIKEASPDKSPETHQPLLAQEKDAKDSAPLKTVREEDGKDSAPLQTVGGEDGKDSSAPLQTDSQNASEKEEDLDGPLATGFKKRKRVIIETDESDAELEQAADDAESVTSLGDEHKSVVLTVFQEEISRDKLMTLHEVRNKMRAHLFLRTYVVQPELVKKIADFVRYKTNLTRQIQLTQLSEYEFTFASTSEESGLRKQWTSYDNAVIKAKFKTTDAHPKEETNS